MGRLGGKVAFITGAARGQGRSHAIHLAEEGADIIAVDICHDLPSLAYPLATPEDLAETVNLVEKQGRRIFAAQVDVRDEAALQQAFDEGSAELGTSTIVVANAGILATMGPDASTSAAWHDSIDIMLTGVLNTVEAAVPAMIDAGLGGSIIIISSSAGIKGGLLASRRHSVRGALGYVAAKHGVVGLMRAYAVSLAAYGIRVNTIHPTGVNTPMVVNQAHDEWVASVIDEVGPTLQNALPIGLIEPLDVSRAISFLSSDEGRYITGVALPVDAGFTIR
jgi:SDR family mycofactocin-dependent oxidoreductase